VNSSSPADPRPPSERHDRRAKWEAFWQGPPAEAEATHLLSVEAALELLQQEHPLDRRRRVLDLGCGGGRVMELLQVVGFDVVGLDLSGGALDTARRYLGPAARLIQADAFQLGVASGSFDAVLSLGYASVGSFPGVQVELARVLRPGGVALVDYRRIGLYHLPLLPARGARLFRAWQRGEVSLPMLGLRSGSDWAEAGFELEVIRLFNTYPPLGRRLAADQALAFERRFGRPFAPLLARTAIARFRRQPIGA